MRLLKTRMAKHRIEAMVWCCWRSSQQVNASRIDSNGQTQRIGTNAPWNSPLKICVCGRFVFYWIIVRSCRATIRFRLFVPNSIASADCEENGQMVAWYQPVLIWLIIVWQRHKKKVIIITCINNKNECTIAKPVRNLPCFFSFGCEWASEASQSGRKNTQR